LQRVSVRRVLKSEALNATEIVEIAHSPQQGVWALAESGQVFHFPSVDSSPTQLDGLEHSRFLKVGDQEELWVTGDRKILRFSGGALEQSIQFSKAGLDTRAVTSLAASRDTAWIGTCDSGLWRVSEERLAREDLPVASSKSQAVWVAADSRGEVRAFVNGIGLCERGADGWRLRPLPERLRQQEISGIHIDPESRTWIYGSYPPLVRQDGAHWKQVAMPPAEVPIEVIAAASGEEGGLWALTKSRGVFRIDRDFDAPSARDLDWIDVGDGLPSNAGRGWGKGVTQSADGRMWFTTALGVAVIDPREWRAVKRASVPPQVHIEEVLLDGLPFDWRASKPVRVPPGVGQVEIRFTAIGLKNPRQNRFRYRLEGLDESWSEPGRGRSAVFHRLPAGKYGFQVIACNSDEVWNRQGATLQMAVLPHWWQTLGFRMGMGFMMLGGLATLRQLKLRQLAREHVRREEFSRQLITSQEAERRRIARELHDGMGQDLLLIKNAAMLTLRKFSPDPAVQERLEEVSQLASHALGDVRAITNDLRPPELDRLGLTAALEAMAEKLANNSGVTLDWRIDDLHGLWSADQEINVYRIVQESVNNAFKHAAPGCVRLEVKKGPGDVEILVEDDGIGFDPRQPTTPDRQQGIGLAGLRERVRILGGIMELKSTPGAGTSLRYRLPIPSYDQG